MRVALFPSLILGIFLLSQLVFSEGGPDGLRGPGNREEFEKMMRALEPLKVEFSNPATSIKRKKEIIKRLYPLGPPRLTDMIKRLPESHRNGVLSTLEDEARQMEKEGVQMDLERARRDGQKRMAYVILFNVDKNRAQKLSDSEPGNKSMKRMFESISLANDIQASIKKGGYPAAVQKIRTIKQPDKKAFSLNMLVNQIKDKREQLNEQFESRRDTRFKVL